MNYPSSQMRGLPVEMRDNIFLFVPVGGFVSNETTKKEIEQLFMEKIRDYKNNGLEPYTYIWTTIRKTVVRITICCGEYIVSIVLYDTRNSVKGEKDRIKEWNLNTKIEKRTTVPLYYVHNYYLYGENYIFTPKDYEVVFNNAGNKVTLTTEEFADFLNGDNSKLDIKRPIFLDYNIIETLTNDRIEYYGLLRVFRELYNRGYWTYGGFKDYIGTNEKMKDESIVTYLYRPPGRSGDSEVRSFSVSKDGKVRGENINPDVKETLEMLGATVI